MAGTNGEDKVGEDAAGAKAEMRAGLLRQETPTWLLR